MRTDYRTIDRLQHQQPVVLPNAAADDAKAEQRDDLGRQKINEKKSLRRFITARPDFDPLPSTHRVQVNFE